MRTKTKKIFAGIVLAIMVTAAVVPAGLSRAQLGVPISITTGDPTIATAISAIAVNTGLISTSVGLPGVSQGVVKGIISGALKTAEKVCSNLGKLQDIAATADSFSSFSFIGGSPAEAAQITTKLAALTALKACDQAQVDALSLAVPDSLLSAQEIARKQATLVSEINSLSVRIEQLKARQSATFKEVLKAVAVNLLLTYSQKLTTKVVNSIVNKYGIRNYLKYADAVASTIYTADYVNKNIPQNQDKVILRGILGNSLMQNDVMPLVRVQAAKNLGFDPGKLVITDPNFYVKAASVGMGKNDAYYLNTVYNEMADQSKTQGKLMAQAEIAGGKGYIPVRNCEGAVNEQDRFDERIYTVREQIKFNQSVVDKLNAAYRLNPSREQMDQLQQAQAKLAASQKDYDTLPDSVATPFYQLCEGISNPGAFVGDTIQTFLQKKLVQDNDLKSENLPFYGKFIQSVASDFLSNIFTPHGKTDVQILTEAGINAANITANDVVNKWDASKAQNELDKQIENGTTINELPDNPMGITFKAVVMNNSITQFQLLWDASENSNISFVTVGRDNEVPLQALQLTGGQVIQFPLTSGSITFRIRAYGKGQIPGKDDPLYASPSLTITRAQIQNVVNRPNVAGAFISAVPLLTRGPALSPRGAR